jgi:two-component system LytT family sensor kinase
MPTTTPGWIEESRAAGAVALGLALLGAALANFVASGENGGAAEYAVTAAVLVPLAVVLFGRALPAARPGRAAAVLAVLAIVSVAAFWSGVPMLLGVAALSAGARAAPPPRQPARSPRWPDWRPAWRAGSGAAGRARRPPDPTGRAGAFARRSGSASGIDERRAGADERHGIRGERSPVADGRASRPALAGKPASSLRAEEASGVMDVALGILLGVVLSASAAAAWRLAVVPRRVLAPGGEAMRAALHAASATLPHLRKGLSTDTAGKSAPHLLALTQAAAIAITDRTRVLACRAIGDSPLDTGDPLPAFVPPDGVEHVHVEPRLDPAEFGDGIRAAVVAPLVVGSERVGALLAFYRDPGRVRPEDTRVVTEAAALVSAQIELSAVAEQGERLARAELRALRAQISPHFVYNALAAVASYIHTRPEEARELLTEFAEFTRYAFRGEQPYVTLADELHYVEKYLRLERARFGDRLQVRLEIAPEVLAAAVPVLSLQPIVENAVRHGVEARAGQGQITIVGEDLGADVELRIIDDGSGMDPEQAREALAGSGRGIGLSNVHQRMRSTFGPEYGLQVDSEPGGGTTVTLTVPKFRTGVRAA